MNGGNKKTEGEKKVLFFKVYNKVEMLLIKKLGFYFHFWFQFIQRSLDVQNSFMFPKCKNSQKRVKNQKSTDKHLSFDGLIQDVIDLSDINLAVQLFSF